MPEYITLENLEAYKLARRLSRTAWRAYERLGWQERKTMGNQFLESTDSVGANIAEGYGRFHYLDKVKFYYNSRGSLLESRHWFEVLNERHPLQNSTKEEYLKTYRSLRMVLSKLISSTLKAKNNFAIS